MLPMFIICLILNLPVSIALRIERQVDGDYIHDLNDIYSCTNITNSVMNKGVCKCKEKHETFIYTTQNQFKCASRKEIDKGTYILVSFLYMYF